MSSLGEQVLVLARDGGSHDQLVPMIETLASEVMRAHLQFGQDAVDNPELELADVHAVMEAFVQYQQAIARLRQALDASDRGAQAEAADAIEGARNVIVSAQAAHQRRMQTPTRWPYLNRVLAHVKYFQRGGMETRHTEALLSELENFVLHLWQDAESVDVPLDRENATTAVREIEQACIDLRDAIGTSQIEERIADVREALLDAARRLTNALGRHVERELSFGPTQLYPVNAVLIAADRLQQGDIEPAAFLEVVSRCRAGLDGLLPERPDPLVVDAAEALKQDLDRCGNANSENLLEAIDRLTMSAHNLSMYMSVSTMPEWDDDESLLDMISDGEARPSTAQSRMLPLLESLVRVGRDYLLRGDPALVLKGLEMLDATVERFAVRTARLPSDEPARAMLEQSIDLLREASQSLRTLIETRDPRALDAAEWLMRQACDSLSV